MKTTPYIGLWERELWSGYENFDICCDVGIMATFKQSYRGLVQDLCAKVEQFLRTHEYGSSKSNFL